MKIKETIERWCCDSKKDLKQYRGSYKKDIFAFTVVSYGVQEKF